MKSYFFEDVTLLITHYNRSGSLERLLERFAQQHCRFEDIVVSDDCSKPEHLNALKELQQRYAFRLITAPENRGLGNNINKGQDAVKTAYTLYVQEDFVPKDDFPQHFQNALQFIREDDSLDIIRFYGYLKYPYLKPYGKGFSKMTFKQNPFYANHLKFYCYSDHPHLRRSNFLKKFGRYVEGKNVDVTELQMSLRFLRKKGQGLFFDEYTTLFDHSNSSVEPSTASYRPNWRQSKQPVVLFLRWFYLKYRFVKNSSQLIFME
ncbi:hypothetical protein GCM10023189_08680 [Nibrella saemangeumensis]|uniref:Glycosyltransferase 2-like domain-containing protein n=1 Tax=Nibrella saemangeumensis TaxID=1084526 RepID=A0ABP8MGS8_9BACT